MDHKRKTSSPQMVCKDERFSSPKNCLVVRVCLVDDQASDMKARLRLCFLSEGVGVGSLCRFPLRFPLRTNAAKSNLNANA